MVAMALVFLNMVIIIKNIIQLALDFLQKVCATSLLRDRTVFFMNTKLEVK